jgi:hypothetical protein
MRFIDILSFCFSILGLYGLGVFYYLRFLIPRNLLPYVSAVLTEVEHLLDRAESTGVTPWPNDYRSALTLYESVVPLPLTVTSPIITVIPINSCGFGWKAIVLLGYYSNFDLQFSTV